MWCSLVVYGCYAGLLCSLVCCISYMCGWFCLLICLGFGWLVVCKWCFLVGCAVMLGCVALALCLLVVGFGVCVFGCAGFRLYLCCLVVVYLRAFVVA